MTAAFTTNEILAQFDQCAAQFTFPMLDNGYVYLADVRIDAYRDEARWAMVIEVIGFNIRAGAHDGIYNCLHLFGNCLKRPPGTANEDFLHLTDDGADGPIFVEDSLDIVHSDAKAIRVRGAASQSICPEFSQFEYLAGGASGKGAVTKVDCEATRELAGGAPPPAR